MSTPILSICIVSFNTAALTLDTVRSAVADIKRSDLLKRRTEIVIVDNNSSDDSVKILSEYKKTTDVPIEIIQNKTNTGFSQANNKAITSSSGKYLMLLNSDTYVQPGALEKLIATFREIPDQSTAALSTHTDAIDRLGILSACLLNTDGTYQQQGGSYPKLFSVASHLLLWDDIPLLGRLMPSTQKRHNYSYPEEAFPKLIKSDWVAGTAVILRRDMLSEIGLLDENIFMYGEDMELCVRAKDHHWDIAIHPTAFITHLKSASSSSATAIEGEFKGYIYIWQKHKPIWQSPFIHLIVRLGILLRMVIFGTMKKASKADIYKAAWEHL